MNLSQWFNHLGNISGFVALLLSLYNWKKSLLKLRVEIKTTPLDDNCWGVDFLISNDSSRAVSILKAEISQGDNTSLKKVEVRNTKSGRALYMLNGFSVAVAVHEFVFPVKIDAFGSRHLEFVVIGEPDPKKSRLVIYTPGKKHKFKINPVTDQEDCK